MTKALALLTTLRGLLLLLLQIACVSGVSNIVTVLVAGNGSYML